eukprot:TRINITY_DN2636_c0_g1_i2.p1 TRINITY_DN2636_c0_g1~~TRINITY_DN2636_c0_g1_i2.p1  ORF type:complete len:143 (+),score=31.79 TRINITY_DN2636_c0_g1_i2:130-558(+)
MDFGSKQKLAFEIHEAIDSSNTAKTFRILKANRSDALFLQATFVMLVDYDVKHDGIRDIILNKVKADDTQCSTEFVPFLLYAAKKSSGTYWVQSMLKYYITKKRPVPSELWFDVLDAVKGNLETVDLMFKCCPNEEAEKVWN